MAAGRRFAVSLGSRLAMLLSLLRFKFQQFLGIEHRLEFPVARHLALVAKVRRLWVLALTRWQDTN